MVATVVVQEVTGGTDANPTYQTVTNRVRLMTTDAFTNQTTAQTTNPVIIPANGTAGYGGGAFNYSYWKHVCLDIAGSAFIITNIKHYSAGDINTPSAGFWTTGTGGGLYRGNMDAGDIGCNAANYIVAVGTAGTTGNPISASHTFYSGQTTSMLDVNSDTSGAAPVVDSSSIVAAGKSKMICLQAKVCNDAVQGTQTAKTLTWQYDES